VTFLVFLDRRFVHFWTNDSRNSGLGVRESLDRRFVHLWTNDSRNSGLGVRETLDHPEEASGTLGHRFLDGGKQ
jgi:hypothetical protein